MLSFNGTQLASCLHCGFSRFVSMTHALLLRKCPQSRRRIVYQPTPSSGPYFAVASLLTTLIHFVHRSSPVRRQTNISLTTLTSVTKIGPGKATSFLYGVRLLSKCSRQESRAWMKHREQARITWES